jgi:hypothetical protein
MVCPHRWEPRAIVKKIITDRKIAFFMNSPFFVLIRWLNIGRKEISQKKQIKYLRFFFSL